MLFKDRSPVDPKTVKAKALMDAVTNVAQLCEAVLEVQAEADRQRNRADELCDKLAASEGALVQTWLQIDDLKRQLAAAQAEATSARTLASDLEAVIKKHRGSHV